MSEIKTLAFIINDANYSLAVATLPPSFALIPVNKVYGDIVVLNDLFAMDTEHRGRVLAFHNSYCQVKDFIDTFALDGQGDIRDGQIHTVRRI